MATPNVGILTTAGKALIDKVNSGQAKISFSKVVFSSMDNSQLSDIQVKALTAISPQEVVVSPPETTLDTTSGETRIRATGTNKQLADGVYVKTYGVFAKDDTGNEVLYGVTVSPNPNYFPAYDGVTPQAVTYSYKTVIQETSNITMTNSNDVYVTQEDLTEAIGKIPQPDLSNYATQQQLATKADFSAVTTAINHGKVAAGTDINTLTTEGHYFFGGGGEFINTPSNFSKFATMDVESSGDNGVQVMKDTIYDVLTFRCWHSSYGKKLFEHWVVIADDSKVVHTADMRKPANQVAGMDDVNAKQDKLTYTAANDATSFHRDATGTVTESGNFPGLQVEGVDVATAADLKSIEASAWRPLTLVNSKSGNILFKDNGDGTASLIGSVLFTLLSVGYDSSATMVIDPPSGYQFTSFGWNNCNFGANGMEATRGIGNGSAGVTSSCGAVIKNGGICFYNPYGDKEFTINLISSRTNIDSSDASPAIIKIKKVN